AWSFERCVVPPPAPVDSGRRKLVPAAMRNSREGAASAQRTRRRGSGVTRGQPRRPSTSGDRVRLVADQEAVAKVGVLRWTSPSPPAAYTWRLAGRCDSQHRQQGVVLLLGEADMPVRCAIGTDVLHAARLNNRANFLLREPGPVGHIGKCQKVFGHSGL